MIPKSVQRFSEKIMLKQVVEAGRPYRRARHQTHGMSSASNTILTRVNLARTPADQFGSKGSIMRVVGFGDDDRALSL
jgi:hypothetical protein